MTIRKAIRQDLPFLLSHDRHIAADEIRSVVSLGRMLGSGREGAHHRLVAVEFVLG